VSGDFSLWGLWMSIKNYSSHKGKYEIVNKDKYIGKNEPHYKSALEFYFMRYCDNNPNILQWQYEGIAIPYINPLKPLKESNQPNANYYPDFYIKYKNLKGEVEEALIEVKSKNETMPPKPQQRMSKKWKQDYCTYKLNESKWKQCKLYCDKLGIKFIVITEDFINVHKGI
jgi:hypothetical protein